MKNLIVQGDVFLTECKIPKEAKQKKGHVLAEGEVTGHSHAVAEKELAALYEHNGILYMRASDNVTIQHEEHKPISVPAGEWKVGIVKEYDPFEEEARNVQD